MAKMLREQIKVTTEGIDDMFSSASRLWMERMNESDDRINVFEAQIGEYEDKFQFLEAQIASLQSTIGGSSSAQNSVYGSSFRSE
jgi:hypothetical protein